MKSVPCLSLPHSHWLPVLRLLLCACLGPFVASPGTAAGSSNEESASEAKAHNGLWRPVAEGTLRASSTPLRPLRAGTYRTLHLDHSTFRDLLARTPLEGTEEASAAQVVLELPWPDGRFRSFRIVESPIMEPGLAEQFPQLKTYAGQGLDDGTATLRFDWTPSGFHAMVLSADGTVLIDPYAEGDTLHYSVYRRRDYERTDGKSIHCETTGDEIAEAGQEPRAVQPQAPHGATLRTYRLAVAATGEYTMFHGGVAGAMNAILTTVNRINLIFERDLAVRMNLVTSNASIIFTDPLTDKYSNDSTLAMLCENPAVLDEIIGADNYDIGHVFATAGGGLAQANVVCSNAHHCPEPGSDKACGASGSRTPQGDIHDVEIVAHELGHQFGAQHTFNGTTGSCSGNRHAPTAFEPGGGSTIMAYAGACGDEAFQLNKSDYFHAGSLDQMIAFITNPLTGGKCADLRSTGNSPPTVNAGPNYTIPRNTPFALVATGSDPNGDHLTYAWEEMDLGTESGPPGDRDHPSVDDGTRPLFRSFPPTASPLRIFRQLSSILNPPTAWPGEALPTTTRSMKFRVTARDNRLGGGGTTSDEMVLNVRADSGPFKLVEPNATWPVASTQTVSWNVANTATPPVGCANVKISLSVDGGLTFPVVLAASTPNDGSETVTVPDLPTTLGRVKVEAIGNVFFDISNGFAINRPAAGSALSIEDSTVREGGSTTAALFTVTLSPISAATVTVRYATANGTATAGSDYVSTSGTLTFTPGEARKTVAVSVNADGSNEPAETFFVNLSAPTNATIGDGQGVGTITDEACGAVAGAVADGGFEAGSPWSAWTIQSSTARGTPICRAGVSCGFGIDAFEGSHVAVFGTARAGAETSTLGQTVTLPVSIGLTLRFQMRVRTISGFDEVERLVVSVDGVPVRTFKEPRRFDPAYVQREVDLTPFADGGSHTIRFSHTNADPVTTWALFLVDNIELVACPPSGVVNSCLADGTFEAGSPWPAWPIQTSTHFGTPICDPDRCGPDTAFAGRNWAWFGGADAPESATLGQTFTLPAGGSPVLEFQMRALGAGEATDTLVISVDGAPVRSFVEPVFEASDLDYSRRQIDLAPFADGGPHMLLFRYHGPTSIPGSFWVDNLQLLCAPAGQSLSIDDVAVAEGDAPGVTIARFTVRLLAPSAGTVTVAYATANGTATAGDDYSAASGILAFAPGVTTQPIEVAIHGDGRDEAAEAFFVNLSSATNAAVADAQGVGSIEDDDLPSALSIADARVTERHPGTVTAVFAVTLSAASGRPVTVAYATADGTATAAGDDYVAAGSTLTFSPGSTTQSIGVTVKGDTVREPQEVFFVNLGSPANATIADGQGVGTITSPVAVAVEDAEVVEGNGGTTDISFAVRLDAPSGETVTMDYSTSDGTARAGQDYSARSGTLSIAAGTTTAQVLVPVSGDPLVERDETFTLTLANPGAAALVDAEAVGTIRNDDTARLSVDDASVLEGDSGTSQIRFTVRLQAASDEAIAVDYATSDGTARAGEDYEPRAGTLSIGPGLTTETVLVPVSGDRLVEADETLTLALANPRNAVITDAEAVGTIRNDDAVQVKVGWTTDTGSVGEGAGGAVATVVLSTTPPSQTTSNAVTVDVSTAAGTALSPADFTAVTTRLSFPAGASDGETRTVRVPIVSDAAVEADEAFTVQLASPAGATLGTATHAVTILDDEPTLALVSPAADVGEGAGTATAAVALSTRPGLPATTAGAVTVSVATAPGTATAPADFTATSKVLTFPAGSASGATQSVNVPIVNDALAEADETFRIALSAGIGARLGIASETITIVDDEPTIELAAAAASVGEGAGALTATVALTIRPGLPATTSKPVTVSVITAPGTATAPADFTATTKLLTFPAGTASGTAQAVSIRIVDDALAEPDETFRVNLGAVTGARLGLKSETVTILDDEPTLELTTATATIDEGAGTMTATVALTIPPGLPPATARAVTVNVLTAPGTATAPADFRATTKLLTFPAGSASGATQEVGIPIVNDTRVEPDETFSVKLGAVTAARLGTIRSQTVTIVDDDGP